MADNDNINENFDTIKTLLNSIRAQGILNTSDVDKILSGINSKLEKINTDEDIDLIKSYLTDLKHNFDERHGVLVSKFAAIESLFANLLKNSAETLKSGEVKELFDIVATNLSVFSREVVSQKESLNDITIRLDAMRSDDSQKRDIIKSISVLKNDIERVTNGFDSIVLSLNENFKTVLKKITDIDPSESVTKFTTEIADIINSSNAILSALQLMDKKNDAFFESVSGLASQNDLNDTKQSINALSERNKELVSAVETLTQKSYKIDSLADKIDASVSIVAGLKSVISENEDKNSLAIIDRLSELEEQIKNISNKNEFEDFKSSLDGLLSDILNKYVLNFEKQGNELKEHFSVEADKISQLLEANITHAISDISSNAEVLTSHIQNANSSIITLCEKNFSDVADGISGLRTVVAQLDENNTSSNNAIFSNIADRLAIFENSLKNSLEKQEDFVSNSSKDIIAHVNNLKNIAGNLDYKMDSSIVEITNSKHEFEGLKASLQEMLNQDFSGAVNGLKTDLYAIKQDLSNAMENYSGEVSEKMSSDIYGKYELIISKLETVEDEVKQAHIKSLIDIKSSIENISSSIVDILSYVSEQRDNNNDNLESKLNEIANVIQDSNLNYADDIRDVLNSVKDQINENIKQLENSSSNKAENIKNVIYESSDIIKQDIKNAYDKILEVQHNFDEIKEVLNVNNITLSTNVTDILSSADSVKADFEFKLTTLKNILLDKVSEFKNDFSCENADKLSELKFNAENLSSKASQQAVDLKNELRNEIDSIIDKLKINITKLSEDLSNAASNMESSNRDVINFIKHDFTDEVNNSVDSIKSNTADVLTEMDCKVSDIVGSFNVLKNSVNNLSTETTASLSSTLDKIMDNFASLKTLILNMQDASQQELNNSFNSLRNDFGELQVQFTSIANDVDEDMARQIKIIEGQFDALNSFLSDLMDSAGDALRQRIDEELGGASERLGASLAEKLEYYKGQVEIIFDNVKNKNDEQAEFIKQQALSLNSILEATLDKQNRDNIIQLEDIATRLKNIISENIELTSADYESLKNKLSDFTKDVEQCNENLVMSVKAQLDDITKFVDSSMDIQAQEVNNCFNEISSAVEKLSVDVNSLSATTIQQMSSIKDNLEAELKPKFEVVSDKIQSLISSSTANLINHQEEENNSLKSNIIEKFQGIVASASSDLKNHQTDEYDDIKNVITETSAGQLQSLEAFSDNILRCVESVKQNSILCKDIISKLVEEQFNNLSKNVEKETDVIVADLIEQIGLLKDAQKDDFSAITSSLEGSVAGYIVDSVNDLKTYLDIKSDRTIENGKIDALKSDLESFIEDTTDNINKLLEVSVFSDAISDLKSTNEVLLTNTVEKMNNKVQEFITENVSKKFDERINLFDKKFIDTVVDKYEEIKLLSTQYNSAFDKISLSVQELVTSFAESRKEFNESISVLSSNLSSSIDELKQSFIDLKSQIMNKSFDEAFHSSVHNQIQGIETLVNKQLEYLDDISELCGNNLPELAEMNTIVKYGVQQSILDFSNKFDNVLSEYNNQGQELMDGLNSLKTDIITQFISIFNQISFVAEQEEIIDFIQEKHDELINVLSRIETNTSAKIDLLKNDISLINQKISSIISSEGTVDYVYSLQDLESDIANLRLVLNDMKADNKSKEFEELINSTNSIYSLVESIKQELPKFNTEEFKKDFENLSEDIVSISTRTNKLILASDESYKTLQDNLQDFKLVINDLDERTRNFAHETGLDKIDNKLGAINLMIQNGAKTNQVFNQVFEYLAEWVDKAGAQIESISDKVETLDDIGQIKVMLEDLKAEAADTSESDELVEALGNIFEKQAKKINSLETKLDKLIVESTIKNKNNKIDTSPLENTLNSFLVAIDEKMSMQQDKIKILETKLEEAVSLMDNKDTVQLTKKVGGMDKQLAKLNKSIEKIASNVIEK